MLNVKKANPKTPLKLVIYGGAGVGKSTLGARSDKPIFIPAEKGTSQLLTTNNEPVDEFQGITSWDSVIAAIESLTTENHNYQTLVLDSADWTEKLAHQKILGNNHTDIVRANGGYGSGYRLSQRMHFDLISKLDRLQEVKGMHIIVTAHAQVKQAKDPSIIEDYDRHEIKCHDLISSIWIEWANFVAFVRYAIFTKDEGTKKSRAFTDGSRIMYSTENGAFQAKNHFDFPSEMKFDLNIWNTIMAYVTKGPKKETAEMIYSETKILIEKLKEEDKTKAIEFLEKHKSNADQLILIRERVKKLS
jgi:hypothetical protein